LDWKKRAIENKTSCVTSKGIGDSRCIITPSPSGTLGQVTSHKSDDISVD